MDSILKVINELELREYMVLLFIIILFVNEFLIVSKTAKLLREKLQN